MRIMDSDPTLVPQSLACCIVYIEVCGVADVIGLHGMSLQARHLRSAGSEQVHILISEADAVSVSLLVFYLGMSRLMRSVLLLVRVLFASVRI